MPYFVLCLQLHVASVTEEALNTVLVTDQVQAQGVFFVCVFIFAVLFCS